MSTPTISDTVGPFRSHLAAQHHLATFLIAQELHSDTLSATVREGQDGGWYVDTYRTPKTRKA